MMGLRVSSFKVSEWGGQGCPVRITLISQILVDSERGIPHSPERNGDLDERLWILILFSNFLGIVIHDCGEILIQPVMQRF